MKKSVICLLGLVLFLLSSTIFATNWIYIEKCSDPNNPAVQIYKSPITFYIDADSITKKGDSLKYWEKYLFDIPSCYPKVVFYRLEVNLATHRYRTINSYSFDSRHIPDTTKWDIFNSITAKEVPIALKYAKEGPDTDQKPDISQLPQN